MGIYNFVKRQVQGKPKEPEDPEITQARNKGYREQAIQNAENEGRQNAVKQFNKKQSGGGFGASIGGNLSALGNSINGTEKAFGFSNGVPPIGQGLDFGLGGIGGGGSAPKHQGPVTERIVKPNGTVIVRQYGGSPGQQAKKKQSNGSPYTWMSDLEKSNFLE